MPKIHVHEKALAHLSRGLYRSPASALRELVSNAWDANATEVQINTNYPLFYQISIRDNGDGFTENDFKRIMEGGIGTSDKRSSQTELIHNRPIIGRLGIGMLGIAQICGRFTVTSKPRKGKGFRAKVILYDLLKEKLDVDDESIVSDEKVDVGEYRFEEFDSSSVDYGTHIITDEVHPTFIKSFQSSLKFESFKPPPLDWTKALKVVTSVHSMQELGDYWRLLWELSVSCPLPYISGRALPESVISDENDRLNKFKFKLFVDGIDLKKPIYLKGNPGGYTVYKLEPEIRKIYNKSLNYHGYLIVQEGLQLSPDELRGILIRIKDVGIGYYDISMLDYRFNEGPRSRWLTGEIFVDDGLEDALNIDRDSFNRFHPEFRAIQENIHDILRHQIFPESYRKIDIRSTAKKSQKEKNRARLLKETISKVLEAPIKITELPKSNNENGEVEKPSVMLNRVGTKLELNVPPSESLDTKKSNRQLAVSVLAIFELAIQEKNKEKQRELFRELLMKLLEGW